MDTSTITTNTHDITAEYSLSQGGFKDGGFPFPVEEDNLGDITTSVLQFWNDAAESRHDFEVTDTDTDEDGVITITIMGTTDYQYQDQPAQEVVVEVVITAYPE